MSERKQVLLAILAFSLIIAAMTWYDLRPHAAVQQTATAATPEAYMIGQYTPLEAVPKDDSELAIWQGTVSVTGELTDTGLAPTVFPQRQVDLVFHITALPKTYKATFDLIYKQLRAWEYAGNMVNTVIIDYDTDAPAWPELATFIKGLKAATDQGYRTELLIPLHWLDGGEQAKAATAELRPLVDLLMFDATGEQKPAPDALQQAFEKVDYPFRLLVGKDYVPAADSAAYQSASTLFKGAMVDLSPERTTP